MPQLPLLPDDRPVPCVKHGDAFDLIRTIADDSLDLIITSPPYWGLRTYGLSHNWEIHREWESKPEATHALPSYAWYRDNGGVLGLEPYPEWYVAHLAEFFVAARAKLKMSGSVWVNIGDTFFARWSSIRDAGRQGMGDNPRTRRKTPMGGFRQEKQLLLIPSRFAIAMQGLKWIVRNDVIWFKPNVPPRPETDRLKLSHEHFFHFVHRQKEGRPKYYYEKKYVERDEHDVVICNVKAGEGKHSATFPEALITPRILSSCPPNGTVLDPFCGTGRALAVASKYGRQSIGFELAPEFAERTTKKLS